MNQICNCRLEIHRSYLLTPVIHVAGQHRKSIASLRDTIQAKKLHPSRSSFVILPVPTFIKYPPLCLFVSVTIINVR